jgi:hypothetical protein
VVAGVLVVSCVLACGSITGVRQAAARAKATNDLKQIGLAYHNYFDLKKKGPANVTELQSIFSDPQEKAVIALAGPGGPYVVIWGANIIEMSKTAGSSNTVLGYEATAPTSGGLVLMGDGFVKQMTAAEFNAATKAQPSSK